MKKAILFTLAALCVSAAQAVTTSWTSLGNTDGTLTIPNSIDVSKPTSGSKFFSIALVMNVDSIPNDGFSYLNVFFNDAKTFQFGHTKEGNARLTWTGGNRTGGQFSATEKNVLGFVFELTSNQVKGTAYLNGTTHTGLTFTMDASNFQMSLLTVHPTTGNDLPWNPEVVGVYIANGSATADDFATVPEPTALALLALGVAGLALKRKHA